MIHQVNILPSVGGLPRAEPSPITTRVHIVPTVENSASQKQLSSEEKAVLRKLQARDAEVRAHEAAHLGAAGGLAVSGASYTYATGPDGQKYAVGGEVNIDTSEGATPEETVEKARRIQAAALAPAIPSSTDLQVAAKAALMGMKAAAELDEVSPDQADDDPSQQTDMVQAEQPVAVRGNPADAAGGQFEFDFSGDRSEEPDTLGAERRIDEQVSPLARRVIERYRGEVGPRFRFFAYA